MLDLTMSSIILLILSSVSAIITSYLMIGSEILYPFKVQTTYAFIDLLSYVLLGLFCGLVSVYFSNVYMKMSKLFGKWGRKKRLIIGGTVLGALVFLFPALYGEGYKEVNYILAGNYEYLFSRSIFEPYVDNIIAVIAVLALVSALKAFATSATFGAGGVGGIFAPSLLLGRISDFYLLS